MDTSIPTYDYYNNKKVLYSINSLLIIEDIMNRIENVQDAKDRESIKVIIRDTISLFYNFCNIIKTLPDSNILHNVFIALDEDADNLIFIPRMALSSIYKGANIHKFQFIDDVQDAIECIKLRIKHVIEAIQKQQELDEISYKLDINN